MEVNYKLYDYMEGRELVGKYETVDELRKAMHERYDDTDGDCYLVPMRKYTRKSGQVVWTEMSLKF